MKASEFCYWLQGHFELSGSENDLSAEQVATIKRHLELVFVHDLDPQQVADKLQQIHDGPAYDPFKRPPADGGDLVMRC